MSVHNALVSLLRQLSREDPERVARCKEVIQDLLDLGTLPNKRDFDRVSIGEIALAFDELDDS